MKTLQEIFEPLNKEPVAFIIKGSPDPDAIGSALALKEYYESIVGEGEIYHDIPLSHSQNKAMVNILDITLHEVSTKEIDEPHYVIVDHCDPIVSGIDPAKCILHIDHHKETSEKESTKFPSNTDY